MVKVNLNGKSLYLDGYLKTNLDIAKHVIKEDWDMVFVVDGIEGSGKSVLAQQIGFYLDPSLHIDNVVFTPEDFKKAVVKAKKQSCVIYDEAYRGLSARASMSFVNKALVSMMAEIRQKNLFIIIVIPCYFELDKYIALWRSRAMLHVYTGDKFQRGFFSFFNTDRKKKLYIKGKKLYEYLEKPNFRGRFLKGYAVDEKEYRAKKLKVLKEVEKIKLSQYDKIHLKQRNILIRELIDQGFRQVDVANILNVDRRVINDMLRADKRFKVAKEEEGDDPKNEDSSED